MNSKIGRWAELINSRGIAGLGARETAAEKLCVEVDRVNEFASTVQTVNSVCLENLEPAEPPLPDFSCKIAKTQIRLEITEFIDPKIAREAKHIMATPSQPLHDTALKDGLWFETNEEWFKSLLDETITSKDQKYFNRDVDIDVLLIWNEAIQVGIEDTSRWLPTFELPELKSIHSVYFQSWYHPQYISKPTWSLKEHPLIGKLTPRTVGGKQT